MAKDRVRNNKYEQLNTLNATTLSEHIKGLKVERSDQVRWNRALYNIIKMGKIVVANVTTDEIKYCLMCMASITKVGASNLAVKLADTLPATTEAAVSGNSTGASTVKKAAAEMAEKAKDAKGASTPVVLPEAAKEPAKAAA